MKRMGILMLAMVCALPAWARSEDDAHKALRVAQSLVEWGDCDAAIPWIEEALEGPRSCRAHYYLAVCLMEDPQLEGGRQVRGAVDAFEDCAGPEWADDVAELRAVVPSQGTRRSSGDGMSDREDADGRQAGEYGRSDDHEDREERRSDDREDREERSGSQKTRQGRDYWDRTDNRRDDERRDRGEREREQREHRDRAEEDRRDQAEERRDREDRERRDREERERRDREERSRAAEEDLLTEIVVEDGEVEEEASSARRSTSPRRASTLPDLDDEEDERPRLGRKGRDERDPWEDDEEWKDPYLDD